MSGLSANLYHRNIFEHEFAQTFTAEAYDFVDHKVLAFAESESDSDLENDNFDSSLSDEYDESLLFSQKEDSTSGYMSSDPEKQTEHYLEKYNNGEDLSTVECWRLWNWLRDEHALVPKARIQPRPNMRSLITAAGAQASMSPDQFDDFIAQQLDRYYSRLLARSYMMATGQRNTSKPLGGEELAKAFGIATKQLLSDASLSYQEFVAIFDVMIRNVASRRSATAVSEHLDSLLPEEPDIILPNNLIPDLPMPTL